MVKVAPSLTSPSKAWAPIKEDEDETETTSLLEKMKEVVEGMQRRRSMQPEAIANVSISNKSEEGNKDAGLQDEMLEDEEAKTVPPQTDSRKPAQSFPATPHMSDLRHVFSDNHAANMPPSYAGVRNLFKAERAADPETPRLDGMREMFNRARELEPNTPAFEGVGEMLATPAESLSQETTRQSNEVKMESTAETHVRSQSVKHPKEKSVVSDHPAKPSSRIAVKTSSMRPMRDGRVTPTDAAQFADDEMQEVVLDKPSERSANAAKGSSVRRTNRRVETEVKQVIIVDLWAFSLSISGPILTQHNPRTRPWHPPSRRAGRGRSSLRRSLSKLPSNLTLLLLNPDRLGVHEWPRSLLSPREVNPPNRPSQRARRRREVQRLELPRKRTQKRKQSPQRAVYDVERGRAVNRWKHLHLPPPRRSGALVPRPKRPLT